MIKSSVEKIAYDIGFDIAHSDDRVQADLINGLCSGMTKMHDRDMSMQICYMVEHFTKESIKVIKEIAGFAELKEKERNNG